MDKPTKAFTDGLIKVMTECLSNFSTEQLLKFNSDIEDHLIQRIEEKELIDK